MKEKFGVSEWTPEKFAELIIKDVFNPALGEGGAEVNITGDNELTIIFKICPFEKAGIDISTKFYCTYTEGLIETALKHAFNDIEIVNEELKSEGAPQCTIKIKIKK